ncbi:MAG: UDP-glucose--hexose-1-phosphate uridylyltransferase [Candidatus Fimadaptatus sp.]|jgi:UDPglucose--hexose-1-phosphate uridylyltransferase
MAVVDNVIDTEMMGREALRAVERLVAFALDKGLVDELDKDYARNGLIDLLGFDSPIDENVEIGEIPATATALLKPITDYACAKGLTEDDGTSRDLFETRVMGIITPSPAETRMRFERIYAEQGAQAATDWFYNMCCACNYIQVDRVARNIRYFSDSPVGELEITINLSKPEKDPKEIAKLKNAPSVGYPRCMLCVENPGYAGRANFPARQNHRMVPLTLNGEQWYMQYSPYKYYEEHCIVLCGEHRPMKIDRGTFERLADFVDKYPHYFLGSNADLPIVGGSILNHDHFQGGRYVMPMDRAGVECRLDAGEGVRGEVVDWPMPTVALISSDRERLIAKADEVLQAWREYSDPELGILAHTDAPHNTITPIMHKCGDEYRLLLVLRNNRVSEEHPLGIFHPHAVLHHIKRENIGLIEVMGLFILPGRLKTELKDCEKYLTGELPMERPAEDSPLYKHFDWMTDLVARHGSALSAEQAAEVMHSELADVCAQVLKDAGVYKQDDAGREGLHRFLNSVGIRARG